MDHPRVKLMAKDERTPFCSPESGGPVLTLSDPPMWSMRGTAPY
jgi:hypothetical protein